MLLAAALWFCRCAHCCCALDGSKPKTRLYLPRFVILEVARHYIRPAKPEVHFQQPDELATRLPQRQRPLY
jgi:hypothetical protein